MTGLNSWLSPAVMEPIGWALIHSLWQCAALAALAALTMALRAVTMVGQIGLLYGLPWGAGIAAAAWLGRRGRAAALTTVVVSALLVVLEFAVRTLTVTW